MSDQSHQSENVNQQPKPPINLVKWGLGCTGISMLLITGMTVLVLILTPVVFRHLPAQFQEAAIRRVPSLANLLPADQFRAMAPDLQEAIIGAAPKMAALMPTRPGPDVLPTVAVTVDTASLLGDNPTASVPATAIQTTVSTGPTSVLTTDTPTQSGPSIAVNPTNTPRSASISSSVNTPTQTITSTPTSTPVIHDNPTATPQPASVTPLPAGPTAKVNQPPVAVSLPAYYHNDGFAWEPQGWNNCGPTNLTISLHYYGWTGTQKEAAAWLKPSYEDKNVSPWQMVEFVNSKTNYKAITRVAGDLTLIKRIAKANLAVIMETGYSVVSEGWMGHYLTVVGWDDTKGTLLGEDTFLGDGPDHLGYREKYDDIDTRWEQFNRQYIIIYPKDREADVAAILGQDSDLTYNAQHALSVARTDASSHPDSPFTWFSLGSSYVLLGDYSRASQAYDKASSVGGGAAVPHVVVSVWPV